MAFAAAAAACLFPVGRGLAAITVQRVDGYVPPDGEPPRPVRRRSRAGPTGRPHRAAEVPLALDLLAVCLSAGAAPAAALAVVAEAVPGPLGSDLAGVARALGLGSSAQQAWAAVHAGRPSSLHRAAERFVHAERSGTALAASLTALAAQERGVLQLDRARAARRVGVLAAAPLGVCFLPAFILVGVLPVVAGLLTGLSLS